MNKLIGIMMIVFLGMGASFKSFAEETTKVRVPVKHVYVPKGFDNNDSIEVVVTGVLPNLCYYAPTVEVEVKGKQVSLNVIAYHRGIDKKSLCPLVVVPFTLTARVGILSAGSYKIVANDGVTADQLATMKVTEASSSLVDEHVYANVDSVSRIPGTNTILLNGYSPSDCYQLESIQAVSNGKDTVALLPIMQQVRESCPMKMIPFSYKFEIPNLLEEKEFLVHVRSMKGASVNYLFVQEE